MIREINLLNYLPLFIRDYDEMKQIMKSEQPEFQFIANASEELKNNQFITTCDEVGIARFEKLLNITPNAIDTLSDRIFRVVSKWTDSLPYTYESFINKLKILCGEDVRIITNFDEYKIQLFVSLTKSQLEQLEELKQNMVPANILCVYFNQLPQTINSCANIAGGIVSVKHKTIN